MFFSLVLVFLLSGIPNLLPGALYEVSTKDETGILRVRDDWFAPSSGKFYVNRDALYAEVIKVEVKDGWFGPVLRFPDGAEKEFTIKPYEAPEFSPVWEAESYSEPRYSVTVDEDLRYGSAMGFWTSYDVPYQENILVTYGRKTPYLLVPMDEVDLTMDVYSPQEDGYESRPLLLMIHGGAFFSGDKDRDEFRQWCEYFASMGYVAASINYRIGFRPTRNEVQRAGYRAVQDAHAAVRYLINRARYQIDPNRVFVAGTSAGAITALNLAFMRDENRPEITRGGTAGDEGKIDKINPGDSGPFSILAVGNMWGAIHSLEMLGNSKASVISFHSVNDPIVPYACGHPFQEYLSPLALNTILFDKMYGSYEIDQELKKKGRRTVLHTFRGNKHSLHLDENGRIAQQFYDIRDKMAAFFAEEMTPAQVSLKKKKGEPQVFFFAANNVRKCYWKVEGGAILSSGKTEARVLLFPDAPTHSVSVSGEYSSGALFEGTLSL